MDHQQPTLPLLRTVEDTSAFLAQQLEVVYTTPDRNARAYAIALVEAVQACDKGGSTPKVLAAAAIELMRRNDISTPTRAYGAVILRNTLVQYGGAGDTLMSITAEDTHYDELVGWVVSTDDADDRYAGRMDSPLAIKGSVAASSIDRVVVSSLSQLVGTAAALSWPTTAPNLIDTLCGACGTALANRRNAQRILLEVCRSCCEPNFVIIPKQRIGKLRQAIVAASPYIVKAAVAALERQYVYLKTATSHEWAAALASGQEAEVVMWACEDMQCCVEILSLCARTSQPMLEALWDANVDHALGTIIMLAPKKAAGGGGYDFVAAAMEKVPLLALDACVAIISNVPQSVVAPKEPTPQHGANIQRLVSFCANVLGTMNTFVVQRRDHEAVLRLVDIIAKAPSMKHIMAAARQYNCAAPLSEALLRASCLALQIPSVGLATDVCEALCERLQGVPSVVGEGNAAASSSPQQLQQQLAVGVAQLYGFEPDRCLLQLSHFAVRDMFNAWTPQVPRHSAEETSYQNEGRHLSQLVCDTSDAFMATYSQLRSAMAPLCSTIAALYPSVSQQFIIHLLSKLQPPTSNPVHDPRTPHGHVTQRSATYAQWDAVEFLIGAMLAPTAFSVLAGDEVVAWLSVTLGTLDGIAKTIFAHESSDATLAPVFMNIMQHYWSVCLPSSEFMFGGVPRRVQSVMNIRPLVREEAALRQIGMESVTLLYGFMRKLPSTPNAPVLADPDLTSARKRGMTLLIRYCSTFAPGICSASRAVGQEVMSAIKLEAQRSLVADKVLPSERSLLNEALAGLTNSMTGEDAEAAIKSMLGPSVETLQQIGSTMTNASLAQLLCDESRNGQQVRDALRDSVGTLTAVLRRSQVNPFTSAIAATVIPLLGSITISVHTLDASHLPQTYVGILDPTDDEQKQAMVNGSGVRRPPDLNNKVGATKRYFAALRMSLYQGLALLPRFLPVDNFAAGVSQILVGAERFPTAIMRDLCEQCLFVVTAECPALINTTLRTLQAFLYNRHQTAANSTEAQQIVDAKQLSYFTKDIATYIRASLIEGRPYADVSRQPPIAGPAFSGTATSLTAPQAPMACLADEAGLELLVSSLCAILSWGCDVRCATLVAIMCINEMLRRDPQRFANACATLFAVSAASIMTNPSVDRPNTREYVLAMLSDLYTHHFPAFAPVMSAEGIQLVVHALGAREKAAIATPAEVEGLHAHLMAVKGPRQKRQCFANFMLQCLPLPQ